MFIVKIPGINGLGKTEGCERAGNAILDALKELYSSEAGVVIDFPSLDLEEIHINNKNLELSNELIYKNSLELFETKPQTLFLGGDHSITYSTTKAFLQYCKNNKKNPCLIVFDAHPDCMEPMNEPSHEEWLRKIVEEGFPKENILLVGIRNSYKDEIKFLKENKIKTISMNSLTEDLQDMCDVIMEFSDGKELYVSLDIDVVDPAFAPSTGYPEIGGLTSRQFIYLIQRIKKIKNLRAVDIVEINEKNDKDNLTIKLGAKIVAELI
jgi:arginase family enzyme